MLHCYLLLDQWIFLCYTAIFYWPTGYFYGTLPFYYWYTCYPYVTLISSTGPLDMAHYPPLLAHWLSLWFTSFPIGPLAVSMVHYCLLLDQWLSLLYTALFYWPAGYLFSNLPSSTGPLDISMVHYPFLLVHLLSLWYTSIFYWPTGYLWVTLSSLIGTRFISLVPYYLLLATGCLYGTLPFPIGPLAIPMLYCYLPLVRWIFLWYTTFVQLAHWLSLCYTAIFYWPT